MTHKEECEKNRAEWAKAIHQALGDNPPQSAQYTDLSCMVRILNHFMENHMNHTMLPSKGGMDMNQVRLSPETGCLDLSCIENQYERCKPSTLFFEYFPESEWNSFLLLEYVPLKKRSNDDDDDFCHESVVELPNGMFDDGGKWDQECLGCDENGDEIHLPEGSCFVHRHFHGKFLIVAKQSLWNLTPQTYQGFHNNMTAKEIREQIQSAITEMKS